MLDFDQLRIWNYAKYRILHCTYKELNMDGIEDEFWKSFSFAPMMNVLRSKIRGFLAVNFSLVSKVA